MGNLFLVSFLSLILLAGNAGKSGHDVAAAEQICGKWKNEDKNLVVQIYKADEQFKARIVWFDNGEDKPMDSWTDKHNPDPALRSRKILGMNVLEKLVYDADHNSWEEGVIYDAQNGRHWNSSAYIDKAGKLRVKGYWHFKFIGKTLKFTRM